MLCHQQVAFCRANEVLMGLEFGVWGLRHSVVICSLLFIFAARRETA